jgi:KipI family sensor histidine kinase inhibitor
VVSPAESASARTAPVRILPMGEHGLLVEVRTVAEVHRLHAALAESAPSGPVDLVPAARTILVRLGAGKLSLHAAREWIADTAAQVQDAVAAPSPEPPVVLDVVYDGPDLAETAALVGLSADALAARHGAARWRVAFTGFAPGFAYLTSEDWGFDIPRLASPRTRVPAGAVGLAGEFSGAYPRETPGGWRLIGTTAAPLFDPAAVEPVLLAPGRHVRFRPVRCVARASVQPGPASPPSDPLLRVIEPGLLTTVQDLGRPGRAAQGIAPSGALDRGALRLALRLVGTEEDAAGLEVTMGGLRAVALRDTWVAQTGAEASLTIAGRPAPTGAAVRWRAGETLEVGWATGGARIYLALRGGIDAPRAAGSRATDRLAGLGLAPLAAGVVLGGAGQDQAPIPPIDQAPPRPVSAEAEIALAPGPRADWFAPAATLALYGSVWRVTNDADRVGMRLDGPELERAVHRELPSEPMVPGALQVPPSGRPTILLADGPVTGGYPVIAVATEESLDTLAQLRPGNRIRFRHARPVG